MTTKLYYNYNLNFFVIIQSGEINFTDLKETLVNVIKSKEFQTTRIGLIDFSRARFNFSTEELDTLTGILADYYSLLPGAYWSIIALTPHETAMTYLFKMQNRMLKAEIQIFSTLQGALRNLNISKESYAEILKSPIDILGNI